MPEQTLRWTERPFGRGAKAVRVRRMYGGSSTAIHAIDIVDRRGRRHELVLRRFIRPNWKYPRLAQREALVLELLEQKGYPAPRLVAFDDGPRETDVRSLVMTRLHGHVELAPERLEPWLRRMAEALPPVHALPVAGVRRYRPYYDPRTVQVPEWSKEPRAWRRVLDIARSPQLKTKPRFIHRDYHPGNILWLRGRITGVVDWISASAGPPQVDVAHCRINLVRLHGISVADRFLAEYASASGKSVSDYDPYWDAMALTDTGFNRVGSGTARLGTFGLTTASARSRLDALAKSIAAQV